MKVDTGYASIYAGEIATVVCRSGRKIRTVLAPAQSTNDAVTIAVGHGPGFALQDIDFDEISWLEIDGPRHPGDHTEPSSR
jgi:hypothetical protein